MGVARLFSSPTRPKQKGTAAGVENQPGLPERVDTSLRIKQMIVRCIPSSPGWLDSLYIGNLVRGLEKQGISFSFPASDLEDFISAQWLRENSDHVDLLHLHWTHYHYTRETWFRSLAGLAKFIVKIILARRFGYRIVWTMHNYMPHERRYPLLHYVERLIMAHLAHTVIAHCERGKELLEHRLFRRKDVSVLPLGNYGEFLDHRSRSEARAKLEISETNILFLFFGSIRPYKGVPDLVRAFRQVHGDNLLLAIVGQPLNRELEGEVISLAAADSRIRTKLQHLPDSELSVYLSAADVVVLPYRDILTSGAAVAALSFGLPVLAPRRGCLPELITPDCGLLYDPQSESLASALERCLNLDLAGMCPAARTRAMHFPWDDMVQQTAQIYRRTHHIVRS